MVRRALGAQALGMADAVIEREEVVALLFNVADIAASAYAIEAWLKGSDDGEAEDDEG
jgi:hypothetical protein